MKYDKHNGTYNEYLLDNGKKAFAGYRMSPEHLTNIFWDDSEECEFTQAERKEIAEYMIELWKEWANG